MALAALVATSPCASEPQPEPQRGSTSTQTPQKTGDGTLRTDLEPIMKRYPQLASAESVEWMSGTVGSTDLGPSTYWIDAVVVVPAAELQSLLAVGDPAQREAPALVGGMSSTVPAGPSVGSEALDELFSAAGYPATVAGDPATPYGRAERGIRVADDAARGASPCPLPIPWKHTRRHSGGDAHGRSAVRELRGGR